MLRTLPLFIVLLLCFAHSAQAQTEDQKTTTPEVVVTGLDNPTGVAVQPITGTVFVANSAAGEIVRIVDGKAQPVITGFPLSTYGKDPTYSIGPLGLAFIDTDTLVVGGGGRADGEELLCIYKLPAVGKSIAADDMLHKLGPIKAKPDVTTSGEGNFHGVVAAEDALYVTSNGDDTKGWILRAKLRDGKPHTGLRPYLATKNHIEIDAPAGITLTANGHLLVGQMGEIDKPGDSWISFYRGEDGQPLLNLKTGLHDITGLAYSRATGRLYAVDFAWMKPTAGGLFRLDRVFVDELQACKPTAIAQLDKPTALAFGKDGELYVTVFGTAQAGDTAKPGKLLKFAKGL